MNTINEPAHEGAQEERGRKPVEVELNGVPKKITGGKYTGRTLKIALGVPAEHELDQVVKGEFRPIANDEATKVHGGEKYVSHCGQGQSA